MSRCSFACPSRTTSSSRQPASTCTAATRQPSGGTAASIASSWSGRCGSRLPPGGVDVTPHDETIEAELLHFLGLPFDLDGFYAWAEGDEILGRLATGLAGFRPPLQVNPFEALVTSITAQQVSLQSAAAIRSRFIERFGVAGVHAHAFPERERVAQRDGGRADRRRLLDPQGGVRRRPRPQRPRPGRARIAARRGGDRPARRVARDRGVDGGLVPRPPPREAARLARRRSGTAQGGHRVLW